MDGQREQHQREVRKRSNDEAVVKKGVWDQRKATCGRSTLFGTNRRMIHHERNYNMATRNLLHGLVRVVIMVRNPWVDDRDQTSKPNGSNDKTRAGQWNILDTYLVQ